jgi:hypothetical protein
MQQQCMQEIVTFIDKNIELHFFVASLAFLPYGLVLNDNAKK